MEAQPAESGSLQSLPATVHSITRQRTSLAAHAGGGGLERLLGLFSPLPREALCLGTATEDDPVLLNLWEPSPGPILLVGDRGAGKTSFLRGIAWGAHILHPPSEVQFGVLSDDPEEWHGFNSLSSCVNVFPVADRQALHFLNSLYLWSQEVRAANQSVLLLLDGLEDLLQVCPETKGYLHWLLKHGPACRIWPIVSVDLSRLSEVKGWLGSFRTCIFARTTLAVTGLLPGGESHQFQTLRTGQDFILCEGRGRLRIRSLNAN